MFLQDIGKVRSCTSFHIHCFHFRKQYIATVKPYCPTSWYGNSRQLAVEETKVAYA
jgi:hypothetical protein